MRPKIGQPCSIEHARTLYKKYICRNHFLETDFTTPERNEWTEGQCHVAQTRLHKIQHSNFLIPHSQIMNSLHSLLSPQKNLNAQAPNRTYGKLFLSSLSIQTPVSILEDSPRTSSYICAANSTSPAASMLAVEDIFSPSTLNVSDGEFRRISHSNTSSNHTARLFIKGINFGHII